MRHLEREENGRAMKAWVARGLAPLAQTRGVDLHGRMGSVLPRCRSRGFSALQGGVGSITTVDNAS